MSALVSGITSTKPGGESEIERQVSKPISTDIDAPAVKNPQVGSRLDIVDDTPIEIPKLSAQAESDNLFNDSLPKTFVEPLGQTAPQGASGSREWGQYRNSAGGYWRSALKPNDCFAGCVSRNWTRAQRETKCSTSAIASSITGTAWPRQLGKQSCPKSVNAPGSGKTTVLCRLTQTVLAAATGSSLETDGHQSNTAEMLTVTQRCWMSR